MQMSSGLSLPLCAILFLVLLLAQHGGRDLSLHIQVRRQLQGWRGAMYFRRVCEAGQSEPTNGFTMARRSTFNHLAE
jgi:hypothetical protein